MWNIPITSKRMQTLLWSDSDNQADRVIILSLLKLAHSNCFVLIHHATRSTL